MLPLHTERKQVRRETACIRPGRILGCITPVLLPPRADHVRPRNLLRHVAKGQQAMVAAAIRTIFVQPTHQAALTELATVAEALAARFPRVAEDLRDMRRICWPSCTFHRSGALAADLLDQPLGG